MRILYHSPYPADACSWYRGLGVLPHVPGVTVDLCPEQVSWATLSCYDLLFMQRPYLQEHLRLLELAQGILPVVVDYDDNLLEVPTWNPCWELYQRPDIRATIKTMLAEADAVLLSTEALAEQWAEFTDGTKTHVIHNAFNNYRLPSSTAPARERIVFWRGSATHTCDLLDHAEAIISIANSTPDWRWVFMGSIPWMLEGKMKFEYHPAEDIMRYFHTIRYGIPAAIHIAPLRDCRFNRAKSNIAEIEARSNEAGFVGGFYKEGFAANLEAAVDRINNGMLPKTYYEPLLKTTNITRYSVFTSLLGNHP